eukprot:gene41672-33101_t
MAGNAGWLMGPEPHGGRMPHEVGPWQVFTAEGWAPAPGTAARADARAGAALIGPPPAPASPATPGSWLQCAAEVAALRADAGQGTEMAHGAARAAADRASQLDTVAELSSRADGLAAELAAARRATQQAEQAAAAAAASADRVVADERRLRAEEAAARRAAEDATAALTGQAAVADAQSRDALRQLQQSAQARFDAQLEAVNARHEEEIGALQREMVTIADEHNRKNMQQGWANSGKCLEER